MAENLIALLLVTSSAKGSSLVYRWPPSPSSCPRLARPRPARSAGPSLLDNPWRAAHSFDPSFDDNTEFGAHEKPALDDDDYEWKRPNMVRDRSMSFSRSTSHPSSGRNTPSHDGPYDIENPPAKNDYDDLLGYSSEFLAGLLCPHRSLCHQKFELLVDDLAFVGHPVSAEADGVWRFKSEKVKTGRGRESRNRSSRPDGSSSASPEKPSTPENPESTQSSWLQTFHFVIALDLPDPSSSASGNVSKYFDIIYEQIAFTVTAVLFQEQVVSNFVEAECDVLGSLKDAYITKGEPFPNFMTQALQVSSIAPAMKSLYEAIKSSSMAYLTIHDLPLELQLPPYLDFLLHSEEENEGDFVNSEDDDGEARAWGPEMSFGWRLPSLAPWKSLLLLDGSHELDPHMNLRGPHVSPEDRSLAEGLIKFLETVSVTLSLADVASILDWDLDSQVFPTVRWLVHHRRAKVVDNVHLGLKTVFTLPPTFDLPLSKLTADFKNDFPSPSVPSLPDILSAISTSASKQSDNHFFATVVRSKDLIPLYHDVVLWMLKRDMLLTLHLRIRVVATQEVKTRVRVARERVHARRLRMEGRRGRRQSTEWGESEAEEKTVAQPSGIAWLSLSPKSARKYSQRVPSPYYDEESKKSNLVINEAGEEGEKEDQNGEDRENEEEDDIDEEDEEEDEEEDDVSWDKREDYLWPSMINDPGRATPLQRRWLSAMSEGKNGSIARRFEQINQYFDGKRTDDEILYRAEISRKQLREVLHHYEEYLQTFLHPS